MHSQPHTFSGWLRDTIINIFIYIALDAEREMSIEEAL